MKLYPGERLAPFDKGDAKYFECEEVPPEYWRYAGKNVFEVPLEFLRGLADWRPDVLKPSPFIVKLRRWLISDRGKFAAHNHDGSPYP